MSDRSFGITQVKAHAENKLKKVKFAVEEEQAQQQLAADKKTLEELKQKKMKEQSEYPGAELACLYHNERRRIEGGRQSMCFKMREQLCGRGTE